MAPTAQAMELVKPIAPDRLRIVQEGFEKRDLVGKVVGT